MNAHFNQTSQAAQWTKLYKPLALLYTLQGGSYIEGLLTLSYMQILDWRKVRGYAWARPKLKCKPVAMKHFYFNKRGKALPLPGSPCKLASLGITIHT